MENNQTEINEVMEWENKLEKLSARYGDGDIDFDILKNFVNERIKKSLLNQREIIKSDLLKIADEGELEDLRRETLDYFNKQAPF